MALLSKPNLFIFFLNKGLAQMRYINPWHRSSARSVWTRPAGPLPGFYWQCWDLWHQWNLHTDKVSQRFSVLCSSCTVVCSSVRSNSLSAKLLVLFSRSPFLICLFFKVLVTGDLEKQCWLFCMILFSSASLLGDVLTAVRICSPIFPAFKRDLLVLRSQCDRTCVLNCSAGCSDEISDTRGVATGQMPRPYAPSPYLATAGNLGVSLLFLLSLGDVLAKRCLGPCDISLHLLLHCWWLAQCKTIWRFPSIAVCFSTGTCHFIVWKKPTLLGLVFTIWGLVAHANMQGTIYVSIS